MAGKIAGTVFTLFILTMLIALIIFYFMHMGIKEEVNDINYNVLETVATTGILSNDLYEYLKESVNRYGDYSIKLKLEQLISPGKYDVFYAEDDIVDTKLKTGDRLTVFLEDMSPTLFGRLINATFMGHSPDRIIETNIKSLKTAVISKSAG